METSAEAIVKVREHTDTVLLSFSRGKDSLAAWLELRKHFRVVPFFLTMVPDLQFVEDSLRYYENWFKTDIIRRTHPIFINLIRNYCYQSPDRIPAIKALRQKTWVKEADFTTVAKEIQSKHPGAYIAYAMSINDNIVRRALIMRAGAINHTKRKFYVHHDIHKKDAIAIIRNAGVKLPVDYLFHERSMNGIGYRSLPWIKAHFPEDWKRLVFWFPLIEAELKRMEYRVKYAPRKADAVHH